METMLKPNGTKIKYLRQAAYNI